MQTDGDLVYRNEQAEIKWAASRDGGKCGTQHSGSHLTIQDDGNLVVYSSSSEVFWSSNTYAQSTLQTGQSLTVGQWLQSPDGTYILIYQADGNLVLYNDKQGKVMWATATNGQTAGSLSIMAGLVQIRNKDQKCVWSSLEHKGKVWPEPGVYLAVQDDGNVVVYTSNKTPLWARTW